MLNKKPLLIAAICFGAAGLTMLIIAAAIFLSKDSTVYQDIGSFLGLDKNDLSNALVCQFAVLFESAAFLFGVFSHKSE